MVLVKLDGMLWQAEDIKLPNNFGQAKAHLLSIKRRLEKRIINSLCRKQ